MLNAGIKDNTYRNGNENVNGLHEISTERSTKGVLIPYCYFARKTTTTTFQGKQWRPCSFCWSQEALLRTTLIPKALVHVSANNLDGIWSVLYCVNNMNQSINLLRALLAGLGSRQR
jgi:hypothetical protein